MVGIGVWVKWGVRGGGVGGGLGMGAWGYGGMIGEEGKGGQGKRKHFGRVWYVEG